MTSALPYTDRNHGGSGKDGQENQITQREDGYISLYSYRFQAVLDRGGSHFPLQLGTLFGGHLNVRRLGLALRFSG